ncbi:hypothetical protein CAPTEDRAFT_226953 [Capitella teleta]|uniref:EGF-like domain-containing protein n=1 Tax=Capitella teleta TaxID=283909 RepID=R7V7K9_CAPTE|nr:hypothetical protein CAPTEDRAFT_226953 [Capitella teleta]|eukprot:ELU14467.1 hypothetical protein CAPTEDRAFT_226953 [Capitella teleta]
MPGCKRKEIMHSEYRGQQPVFLMTGRHTDQTHVLSMMFGNPETAWYQDILTHTQFHVVQWLFNPDEIDLHAVATDYQSQRAYIFDPVQPFIRRLSISSDGRNITEAYGLPVPVSRKVQGLAVDWVSRNLYWTDATFNWIGMTPLKHEDKYKFIVRQNLFSPHGIGVHPKTSSLFWADSESGLVERSDLKGGNRRTFIPNDGSIPSALIVYEDRVYWKSGIQFSGRNQVYSIGVNGQGRRTEISDAFTVGCYSRSYALHFLNCMYQGLIFTTTSDHPYIYDGEQKTGYTVQHLKRYNGLAMYAQDKQPEMDSPCDGKSCQSFCVATNDNSDAECFCGHYEDETRNGQCQESPELFYPTYIYHNTTAIYRQSTWATGRYDPPVEVLKASDIKTFDVDHKNRRIFYVAGHVILSSGLTVGSSEKVVARNTATDDVITGIAVDWINHNIYWTISDSIVLAAISGEYVYRLHSNRDHVGDVVVHPGQKKIFWIENGAMQSIFSSNLDGSEISTFISSDTGHPRKLHIDYSRTRLYWTDSAENKLESINLNGFDRKTHLTSTSPYGVAVFGDQMAWTSSEGLLWAFKENSYAYSLETRVNNLRDLKVYSETGFPDFPPNDSTPTAPTKRTMTESSKATMTESTKATMTESSKATMTESTTTTLTAPTKRTMTESSKATMTESTKATMTESSKATMTESTTTSTPANAIVVAVGAGAGCLFLITVAIAISCILARKYRSPRNSATESHYEVPRGVPDVPHDYTTPELPAMQNRMPHRTANTHDTSSYLQPVHEYDEIRDY